LKLGRASHFQWNTTGDSVSKRVACRIEQVQDPVIPIVGRLIADHPGTISLGQGVVHYPPPAEVLSAISRFDGSIHRYGDVCGDESLREQIRNKLWAENRIDCAQDAAIVVTPGSNMGFFNTVLAIADVGDEIILMSPYFFNHEMAIEIAGCTPVIVPTTADYQLDVEAIRQAITPRTRAIVTVSPNNPTGAVYPPHDLIQVNALCKSTGIYHVSDEAYEYFVYDGAEHFSPASLPGAAEHTISLFTLSKAYGMAGWRTGFMVVPQQLLMPIKKIQDSHLVCPPRINQIAASAALKVGFDWCRPRIAEFARVRNTILSELEVLRDRCTVPVPRGAFYMLLQVQTQQSDMALVESLVRDFGVAVLPGNTFGVQDTCALRISYGALDYETVMEGVGRLRRGLENLM
jgi:aspartate/methionine/tyrosine aminotransferase